MFVFGFGLLISDTWSQLGHSVSCMTILFLNLKIIRPDIRPHIKWAVSLVIAYVPVTLILPRDLRGYVWVNILTLSSRGGRKFYQVDHKV